MYSTQFKQHHKDFSVNKEKKPTWNMLAIWHLISVAHCAVMITQAFKLLLSTTEYSGMLKQGAFNGNKILFTRLLVHLSKHKVKTR